MSGGPRRVEINPRTIVQEGMMIEITREERRRLEECTSRMRQLVFMARKGWLFEFVNLQTEVNRIIHTAVGRAHQLHG